VNCPLEQLVQASRFAAEVHKINTLPSIPIFLLPTFSEKKPSVPADHLLFLTTSRTPQRNLNRGKESYNDRLVRKIDARPATGR
jgi:hypothetical protein